MADQDLMLEILKQIQSDVATLKHGHKETQDALIIVREDIHSLSGDIHSLSGRILLLEKSQAKMNERLGRIEKRLDLADA